jgi:hypothetical protein
MDSATKDRLCRWSVTPMTTRPKKLMETAEVLRDRRCDTTSAPNEFTDPRYGERYEQVPMPRPLLEEVAMLPAELGA